MKKTILFLILICLLICSSQSFGAILFYDNCENNIGWNTGLWSTAGTGGSNSLTVSSEKARIGEHSYKFVLAPYPTSGTQTNVELILRAIKDNAGHSNFNIGQEYWIGYSIYIPFDFQSPSGSGAWLTTSQTHGAPDSCDTHTRNPNLSFFASQDTSTTVPINVTIIGESDLCTTSSGWGDKYKSYLIDVTKGAWNDIAINVKWAYDSTGFFNMYVNGNTNPVIEDTGPNCFNDSKGPFFKMGMYGHLNVFTTVFYDEFRVGDANSSLAEISPDTAPAGGGNTDLPDIVTPIMTGDGTAGLSTAPVDINLIWNDATPSELPDGAVMGYQVFYKMGTSSVFDLDNPIYDGANLTITDTRSDIGNYRYAVRAYYTTVDDTVVMSDLSNTVGFEIYDDTQANYSEIINGLDDIINGVNKIKQYYQNQ